MAIREFELMHGAVITKLLRSTYPESLRLVETQTKEAWSSYTVNDEVNLLISHSKSPRRYDRGNGGQSWQFTLSANQMKQVGSPENGRPVWIALVCTDSKHIGEICLLNPAEVSDVLEIDGTQQTLTIRKPAGRGQFRVMKDRREAFKVPLNRLDNWEPPGA